MIKQALREASLVFTGLAEMGCDMKVDCSSNESQRRKGVEKMYKWSDRREKAIEIFEIDGEMGMAYAAHRTAHAYVPFSLSSS